MQGIKTRLVSTVNNYFFKLSLANSLIHVHVKPCWEQSGICSIYSFLHQKYTIVFPFPTRKIHDLKIQFCSPLRDAHRIYTNLTKGRKNCVNTLCTYLNSQMAVDCVNSDTLRTPDMIFLWQTGHAVPHSVNPTKPTLSQTTLWMAVYQNAKLVFTFTPGWCCFSSVWQGTRFLRWTITKLVVTVLSKARYWSGACPGCCCEGPSRWQRTLPPPRRDPWCYSLTRTCSSAAPWPPVSSLLSRGLPPGQLYNKIHVSTQAFWTATTLNQKLRVKREKHWQQPPPQKKPHQFSGFAFWSEWAWQRSQICEDRRQSEVFSDLWTLHGLVWPFSDQLPFLFFNLPSVCWVRVCCHRSRGWESWTSGRVPRTSCSSFPAASSRCTHRTPAGIRWRAWTSKHPFPSEKNK